MIYRTIAAASLSLFCAAAAQAECARALSVHFSESAPRDRFDIVHTATGVVVTGLRIDLNGSAGSLIFDTAAGGTGVEVFQPFRPEGALEAIDVADGATDLALDISDMTAGQRAGFTIDVDDRRAVSDLGQIRVTGGEMAGARVVFSLADGGTLEAEFDQKNRAKVCS